MSLPFGMGLYLLRRLEMHLPMTNSLAVFVKPWKHLSLSELGAQMQQSGVRWTT
jgi:hypothetical protein